MRPGVQQAAAALLNQLDTLLEENQAETQTEEEWEAEEAEDGHTYYLNRRTSETTWTPPQMPGVTDVWDEEETEDDESAASIPVRNRREVSVCKSELEGETYYMDNTTGETTWELPDDAFIMAEEGCTLDLGPAPKTPEDPPCKDTPRRRLHQFSVSVTEGGDEYFINNETQETTWYLPEDSEIVEI